MRCFEGKGFDLKGSQTSLKVNSCFSLATRYWLLATPDFSCVFYEKSGLILKFMRNQ